MEAEISKGLAPYQESLLMTGIVWLFVITCVMIIARFKDKR